MPRLPEPVSARSAGWRRRGLRAVLAAALLLILTGPPASADPQPDVNHLPAQLQKYVPGSAAFAAAPWMTSPACAGRGGDFSIWTASVLHDTPDLLAVFQPGYFGSAVPAAGKPLADAILAAYRQVGTELGQAVPAGYCVDDFTRWAGDFTTKPFGFAWGTTEGDGHQSIYSCTTSPDGARNAEYNRFVGAERVACDGVYVNCANAPEVDKNRCETWNSFADTYIRRVDQARGVAISAHKANQDNDTDSRLVTPGDIVTGWFVDLTKAIATGGALVLAESMTFWTRTDNTTLLTNPAIGDTQDLLRYVGVALLVGGMMWQGIMMIVRRKADPLVTAGTGLLAFVGWSTLGGTVAVLLNEAGIALTQQVLGDSINGFAKTVGDSLVGHAATATGAVFFLSIIVFFLATIQWALGFFRQGAVAVLLALLPTAAAGQLTETTKPWLKKVTSWGFVLLVYQPVSGIIYMIGFKLVGDGEDLATVLVGIAVLGLAAVSMPTMMRFFDWGGGLHLASGGHGGGAAAVGAAASVLGGGGIGGFGRFMDSSGPAGARAGGSSSGAPPIVAAHRGNGPGDASGPVPDTGLTSSPGAGQSGGTPPATKPPPTSGAGGTAAGSTPPVDPAGAGAAGGATAGSGAAAANPAGAAVGGAQQAKDSVVGTATAAGNAVGGAMTDGGADDGASR
ncbi:hypothetical protein [Amycolatopsis tolypomycina]|uniref:hypothetical protein n=1 Tax=Amycolatopsis tolypomycina TaxID=208445 RepID=UPI0033B4E7FA